MASILSTLTKRRTLGHQLGHHLVKTVPLRKFRLVCDNAPVHSCIERFDNLEVVFLPAHCTAGKKTGSEMFESDDSACERTDDDETHYWYEQQGEQAEVGSEDKTYTEQTLSLMHWRGWPWAFAGGKRDNKSQDENQEEDERGEKPPTAKEIKNTNSELFSHKT